MREGMALSFGRRATPQVPQFIGSEHYYVPVQSKLYKDSAATIQASVGGPVGAWEDMSGQHLATQSTTANKPTLRQDANGNLYVECVPNEDFLEVDVTTTKATKVSSIPGVGAFSAEVEPGLKGRSKVRIQSTTAGALVRSGTYSQDARGDWASALDQHGKDVADNVTSFNSYFRDEPLTHYDAHAQDTSSVTSMDNMFRVASISDFSGLSGWDTSQVTDMRRMFQATSVSDLSPLSGWDTSSVTGMDIMFRNTSVSDLSPLSGWDTSQVTNMRFMFGRTSVSDLSPLSGWDTSSVTNMGNMFNKTSVSDLSPLSGWDTSSVTTMGVMFRGTSVSDPSTISGWDVANVTKFTSFLEGAPLDSVKTGDMLAGWTGGSPNLASNMESGVTLGIQNADYNNMDAGGQTAVDDLCCSTSGCTSNGNTGPDWTINATNAPSNC
jgi:hypothetical protein